MPADGLLLGLDLTEVDRVAGVLERHGERFLARIFRDGRDPARRAATRAPSPSTSPAASPRRRPR